MSKTSVSQRLHRKLKRLIASTKPGSRLPSEPALAKQMGVSRATLREAMRTFETQGLIRRRQGSGTFVTKLPQVIESGLEVLQSIETLTENNGLSITFTALEIQRRSARDQDCQALDMKNCDEIISVSRVIESEGRPVAYLTDILPIDVLTPQDLEAGFTGSILDLLLQRGEPPLQVSRTEINAISAPTKVAKALNIQRGDVLLHFIADLYTTDGRVVDHSFSYFLPGVFRFHVVRRVGLP